jgi:tryptophan 7-halogenase
MTQGQNIKRVVIAGGGTAGWMTACALSNVLPRDVHISLIESDDIGTIGVGEATIPPLVAFNRLLGIDEAAFLTATKGTIKLGIEFVGWGAQDARYIHPFGTYGVDMQALKFHQFWLSQHLSGHDVGAIGDYNLCEAAARLGRFTPPNPDMGPVLAGLKYAYHFDASLYAKYLRQLSEKRGVERIEGKIAEVKLKSEDGYISGLRLEDGREVVADLFIDCTGFRALLIEGALKTGFESWRHWLPCDRAFAVPCTSVEPPIPYTRATADKAGWRWRIPLQHRTGNGYVFCSDFIDEAEAKARLLETLDGEALADPMLIRIRTGRQNRLWEKNCVAIGLAGGFLEPLESTAIHLIQIGITRLLHLFPHNGFNAAVRDEYNDLLSSQYALIRDFIIAHYKVTTRADTPFWKQCRDMDIPVSLRHKLDLFKDRGRIIRHDEDLFAEDNWLAVLLGQGLMPQGFDPLVCALPEGEIRANLSRIRSAITRAAASLPTHQAFLNGLAAQTPNPPSQKVMP